MRKMLIAIVIVLALTACVSAQDTSAPIGLTFYASGGFSLPVLPDGIADWWKSGSNFGGGIGYDLSPYVAMQGFFTVNSFSFKVAKFDDMYIYSSPSGGDMKTTTFTVNVKASFIAHGNRVTPYFVGGLGYFKVSFDEILYGDGTQRLQLASEESKSSLAACLGFGIDVFALEQAGVFAEFVSTAGGVKLKTGLYGVSEDPIGYMPFKFGAFYQL